MIEIEAELARISYNIQVIRTTALFIAGLLVTIWTIHIVKEITSKGALFVVAKILSFEDGYAVLDKQCEDCKYLYYDELD